MDCTTVIEPGDRRLVQIVDAALAEAARKAGHWLVCRPGCMECCKGPFAISQLDALRLRRGLAGLAASDAQRAERVKERVRQAAAALQPLFPGGLLDEERLAELDDDAPCPALDPATGTCDLYDARPMTCRTFGPPVRCGSGDDVGVCELCFNGATDDEIAACEAEVDPGNLEASLIEELESTTGARGQTLVAFALA